MPDWNRVATRPMADVVAELGQAKTLLFTEPRPGVGLMTVNRPDRGNSQTVEMFGEIAWYAHVLRKAPLRALIITGAGGATFCTGFDLQEVEVIARMTIPEFNELVDTASAGTAGLRSLPYPVIAAISGPVAGGGLSLALSADIRLTTPTASFSAGFVRVGLSIGELGASWHLSRVIGPARAAEISFTGRTVKADEAVRIGLANRIAPVDGEQIVAAAVELAEQIVAHGAEGIRATKNSLIRSAEIDSFIAALELENRSQVVCRTTL
ncbi:enoyl-CoA hydratase/isomerase family protein [Mycobacterium sp. CVI_P3]|uniref:Enoyl-CoA hydratase/isomerase family protein n=1 Tax=Mycobacterium pinniadriaticum TaxID=2994102 RepID=A0ABT3SI39_9MYCO|nr:enoyl-CoA hydratase/isomerase family protein [Mycobacterium pinniadriaticum]MCX2932359.1 enoyl-CoA hydratase/isomerase family protein [Mycobacterium pinniadriaticum]MCX2938784.1 enoyl-CoA hydratase/isomerase family protein [Mycobacterium pinniadriaticum]